MSPRKGGFEEKIWWQETMASAGDSIDEVGSGKVEDLKMGP